MDIKRDEAFEEAYAEICKPIIRRPYPRNQNGEYVYKEIHEAHLMWQQAQKVAVPDAVDAKSILHEIDCYFDSGLSNTERTANNLIQSIYEKLSGEIKAQEKVG